MSPQGLGLLDKMNQMSLEDMLAIVRPFLTILVSQKRGSGSPVGILSRIVGHPLPPALQTPQLPTHYQTPWSNC